MVWLEIKRLLRQPTWWIFAVLIILVVDGQEPTVSDFSLEPLSDFMIGLSVIGRSPLASLGEWGRLVLFLVGGLSSVLVNLLISFLVTYSFHPELVHREVLWSTPEVGKVHSVGAKLLAVSFVAIFSVILGACAAFLHPSTWGVLVLVGGSLIPIYLVFAFVHVILWAAICMFLLFLTQSRRSTIGLIALFTIGHWFLSSFAVSKLPWTFVKLFYQSYRAYYCLSPFTPFGVLPTAFLLRGVIELGLAVAVFGAASWLRGHYPEWKGVGTTAAKALLGFGIILVVGGAGMSLWETNRNIAPFELWQLWLGKVEFGRPYIWTRDGRLLTYLGRYMVLRLPPSADIPAWAQALAQCKQVNRYQVGTLTGKGESSGDKRSGPPNPAEAIIGASQDLILVYPRGQTYPPELEGMVRRFRRQIQPMLKRAAIWQREDPSIFVLGAYDFLGAYNVYSIPEGLLLAAFVMSDTFRASSKWWDVAWALTASSGLNELLRCYLSLYLMEALDKGEVERASAWLQDEAKGKSLQEEEEALARLDEQGEVVLGPSCPSRGGLCECAWLNPQAAQRILEHWRRGEELGHENYIRMLLEGAER